MISFLVVVIVYLVGYIVCSWILLKQLLGIGNFLDKKDINAALLTSLTSWIGVLVLSFNWLPNEE